MTAFFYKVLLVKTHQEINLSFQFHNEKTNKETTLKKTFKQKL